MALLLFDGDCGFCRQWVEHLSGRVRRNWNAVPYQTVELQFPEIPKERFKQSIILVENGRKYFAGEAGLRVLSFGHALPWQLWLWLYEHSSLFARLTERAYRIVADHRRSVLVTGIVSAFTSGTDQSIPVRLARISLTLFVAYLIPVYTAAYGPGNFLWLSDIGLFLTLLALWLESPLLLGMAAVGVLPLELAWNIDFFATLLTGNNLISLAAYMFDPSYGILLRALSLFHVVMPVLWVCLLLRWGYDRRALAPQTALYWGALALAYFFTEPKENVNWIFLPEQQGWDFSKQLWPLVLAIAVPTLIYWPFHRLLTRTFSGGKLGP